MEGFTGAGGHVHAYMRKLRLAYVERSTGRCWIG